MKTHLDEVTSPVAWNKGRLIGQKAPLKPKEFWAIRIRLQLADKARDLALFRPITVGTPYLKRPRKKHLTMR